MVTKQREIVEQEWVLLSYRMPREPSTPRIAVWRKLKELGVAQLGDGLVALPYNANTQEQLEWVTQRVLDSNGEAIVWIARPSGRRNSRKLEDELTHERSGEYSTLVEDIDDTTHADQRTIARWRRQLRRIERRDYFHAEGRDRARLAIDAFAHSSNTSAVSS